MTITVLEDRYLVGRKNHTCQECGCVIPKGVKHYVQVNVYDGQISRWRVHSDCASLYWKINTDWKFQWGEAFPLSEFTNEELSPYRGRFPHAVTRLELRRELSEIRWLSQSFPTPNTGESDGHH